MEPLYVGVVGSRRRATLFDRKIVINLIEHLVQKHTRIHIVSGGCPAGADAFVEEAAQFFNLPTTIFPIDKKGVSSRWEFTKRAYERNRKIAERSDEIYCLVASDRTGGTENTILHALDLRKKIFLVSSAGEIYLSKDGSIPDCEPDLILPDLSFTA